MQITIELDQQHIEKLHEQERKLKKTVSELITLAIDEIYSKKEAQAVTEGQKVLDVLKHTGYLAGLSDVPDLSENYKDYLDWNHKV